MDAIDEIKALGLAAFINFMIYYIVGSVLIIIGVTEVSLGNFGWFWEFFDDF